MIFLSHNHKDKQIIEQFALVLSNVFGQEKIFYDRWSIQPGQGIIDKINEGLSNCQFFFFFVSKNSLNSNMVKLEWQNALFKATKNQCKLIPVKLDDCLMPDILVQSLYIDVFGQGPDIAIRQIIDVINGKNIFRQEHQTYENLRAYIKSENEITVIEIRAETYMEPISRFIILADNEEAELNMICIGEGMIMSGFQKDLTLDNGLKANGFLISLTRATTPGFPTRIKITPNAKFKLNLRGVMKAVSSEMYRLIPLIGSE